VLRPSSPGPTGPGRPLLALAGLTALLVGALLPLDATPSAAAVPPLRAALRATPADLGHDRLGLRRGDTWFLRDALDAGPSRGYREDVAGWAPLAGDFDGDGDGSVGLFSAGVFRLRDREGGPVRLVRFGGRGDVPVVGDWDGDGVDTVGVFRAGRWYLRGSNSSGAAASRAFDYGRRGDVPVVGDWNGDGRDDVGVFRSGTWFQRDAAGGGPSSRTFPYGRPGDLPVAGDWDHDGKDTPGVFRAGTWFLRQGSFTSPSTPVRFGGAGDRPVVRRTRGLAPGVTHQVVRDPAAPWVAHVATVDLAAASSLEPVLSQDRLAGVEALGTMVRRAGAVLGINGDYFLPSGRPVHLHGNDGQLVQTPTVLGRAFGLDATGTRFTMGHPDVHSTVSTATGSASLHRMNNGGPGGGALAGWTAAGWPLESPGDEQCYALLKPAGAPAVRPDGAVDTPLRAGTPRCGGPRPALPPTGTLVAAEPTGPAGDLLRSLRTDVPVTLTTQLGFPGAVDALGGNPRLVVDGAVADREVDGEGDFFARHGRTAVGVTADGRMLLVVVDGRQPGYSRGMTLRELAELLQRLGATQAMNLDGGGSSEMVVNGLTASRPSDGQGRGIANALVVLPGADHGQPSAPVDVPALRSSLRGPASTDGGSTGGLADALLRDGVPLPAELRRTAEHFRAARD
jgi:hypothetical protein